jgi:cell division initiation protein
LTGVFLRLQCFGGSLNTITDNSKLCSKEILMKSAIQQVLNGTLGFTVAKRSGGYDLSEVDQFREDIRQYVRSLETERDGLQQEVILLRSETERLKKMEQTLSNALLTAQKVADDLKDQAQKAADELRNQALTEAEHVMVESKSRAEEMLESARNQSEEMLQSARADARQLEVVIQTLQQRRSDLAHELSEVLHRYLAIVEENSDGPIEFEKTRIFRPEDLVGIASGYPESSQEEPAA